MPRDGSYIYTRPFPDVEPATTIESAVYNGFTADVATDLNAPRPIIAGGTGATNALDAMINLKGEVASQVVTNFDSYAFVAGSFYANAGATSAPTANACSGIVYVTDSANMVVEARDNTTGLKYTRRKVSGTWVNSGAWLLDASDKVARAGDTMTGVLTAPGYVANSASGFLVGNTVLSTTSLELGSQTVAGPAFIDFHSGGNAGDYDTRIISSGGTGSGNGILTLTASNVAISSTLTAGGNIAANGGAVIVGSGATGTLYFGPSGNNKYLSFDGTNFVLNGGALSTSGNIQSSGAITTNTGFYFEASNAVRGFWNGTQIQFTHAMYAAGTLTVAGSTVLSGLLQCDGGRIVCKSDAFEPSISCYKPGYSTNVGFWNSASGMAFGYLDSGGAPSSNYMTLNTTKLSLVPGTAEKPGGGPWTAPSDLRIKNVLGDYSQGLDAILQLRPVRYAYKQDETKRPYIGLIAQEAELVMPEMVTKGHGNIGSEDVDDFRTMDTNALVFALINAVKTLTARIEALEARH